MPRRKTQQSEVSEPAVSEANISVEGFDETLHDANPTNVQEILDIADGKVEQKDDSEVDQTSTEEFIQYVGRATERNINSDEWPAGVGNGISVSWGFHNDFKIPAKSFTQEQRNYLLGDQDGGFKLVDGARS